MSSYAYTGTELALFKEARNWKGYIRSLIQPYLSGSVLEVGAGNGTNTLLLCKQRYPKWVCLEPDGMLAAEIAGLLENGEIPPNCSVIQGTIDSISEDSRFDSILYLDVLEHIEDDARELAKAAEKLSVNGYLIVLSPAHNRLFSPFDKAIGHFRRYDKTMLKGILPPGFQIKQLAYLDSVGSIASYANRILLAQSMPKASQIFFWDRAMIPMSRVLDRLAGYKVGKSVLAVFNRAADHRSTSWHRNA